MPTPAAGAAGRLRPSLVTAAAVAAALAVAAAPAARAQAPARTAAVAFSANAPETGGHFRITVVNTDGAGTALNPAPASPYDDVDPAWSPDGTRIAFSSTRSGNNDIFVMRADGTGVQQITSEPRDDRYPAWSPDGSRIAYRGYTGPTGGSQIIVAGTDGSNARAVPATFGGDQPTWSPDGTRIAFTRTPAPGVSTDDEVLSVPVDGSAPPANLTQSPATSDRYPSWSPGGGQILFRRVDTSGAGRELFLLPAGGGPVTNLTPVLGPGRSGSWSPDGAALTFVSYRDADANQEIWLGSLSGAILPRQLTHTTWTNEAPRWGNIPVAASPVPPSSGGTTGAVGGTAGGPGAAAGTVVVGGGTTATGRSLGLALRVPRQRLGRRTTLRAQARCSIACALRVSGQTRKSAALKRALRTFVTRRRVGANRWVAIRVRFPRRNLQKVRVALRRHRPVRVTVTATARTVDGRFSPAAVRAITLRA